ncbi:MAG: hypothetical protein KGJ68_05385 [Gammaproteobacteria bacterium]|nr:hypothetical protein [Gammaproteobacteria bacterium]
MRVVDPTRTGEEEHMFDRIRGTPAAVDRCTRFAAALLAASVCAAADPPARAAADSADQPAAWVQKEINFRYVGFTTKYSCDGLRDRMQRILLKLGARDDLNLTGYGCMGVNSPETTPGVRIVMHVLQPASAGAGRTMARWKTVDLLADRDLLEAARDCELISQLDRDILPLLAVRNVNYSAVCPVHEPPVGGTRLKLDVLVPAPGATGSHPG